MSVNSSTEQTISYVSQTFVSTTDATSTTDASVVLRGGMGIGKKLTAGSFVVGAISLPNTVSGSVTFTPSGVGTGSVTLAISPTITCVTTGTPAVSCSQVTNNGGLSLNHFCPAQNSTGNPCNNIGEVITHLLINFTCTSVASTTLNYTFFV